MVYCVPASRGDKGGEIWAFMRLAQSKLLLRVISLAEDIGSQRDRENSKSPPGRGGGFTVSSGIRERRGVWSDGIKCFQGE